MNLAVLVFLATAATGGWIPPAVTLRLSDSVLAKGARVRATVALRDAGYLVVLRADGDGRLSVLFPTRPDEATPTGGGATTLPPFVVAAAGGRGVVLAMRLDAPPRVAGFVAGGAWNYDALLFQPTAGNAEAALYAIAERLSGGLPFDWTAAGYAITGPIPTAGVLAPGEWYAREADIVGRPAPPATGPAASTASAGCPAAVACATGSYGAAPVPAPTPAPAPGSAPATFYAGYGPYYLPRERIVLPRRFIEDLFAPAAPPAPPATPSTPPPAARAVYVRGRLAVRRP